MPGPELKVPPDVVWLVAGAMMWLVPEVMPEPAVALPFRLLVAGAFAAAGAAFIIAARVMLSRARTTWHPAGPEHTTTLVRSGVFRFSRNPIYLGMLLVLIGLAVVLANPLSLVPPAFFVWWMNRFQIQPEERVLLRLFGQEYRSYLKEVRRWL